MVRYMNSKSHIEYDVMEAFIEVDYDSDDFDNTDAIRYCVQGLIPGTNHIPEVVTLELCSDVVTAIRIHQSILSNLGLI